MSGGRAEEVLLQIVKNTLKSNAVAECWGIVVVCAIREGCGPFLLAWAA